MCYVVSKIQVLGNCIRCGKDLENTLKYGKRCPTCEVYYVSRETYNRTSNVGVFAKIGTLGNSEKESAEKTKKPGKIKIISKDTYNTPRNVRIREGLIKAGVLNPLPSNSVIAEKKHCTAKADITNEGAEPITAHDFVVRLSVLQCRHKNHHVKDIQAVLTTISRQGTVSKITVPAGYCPSCNTYFIMDNVYQRIKHSGVPLCRTMDEKTYISGPSDVGDSPYAHLAQESALRQFGYTVNQAEDLPAVQRRNILAAIVDHEVLTKNEIISYLEYFINNSKNQRNKDGSLRFSVALSRWKEDKDWISVYKIGTFKEVAIKRIITNR